MHHLGRGFGKVILLGEHAVVYGVPAIAVGLDRGATADAMLLDGGGPSELVIDTWTAKADDGTDLGLAFSALLEATGIEDRVRVLAHTDLLASAGLGCSAALGVAMTRALLSLRGIEEPAEGVASRALAWEKIFHGTPSGIDTTVAARGGCLLYERGDTAPRIDPISLGAPLVLAIGYTGLPASTREMVDAVARLRQRKPEIAAKAFEGIGALVRNARLAMQTGDVIGLGRLLDFGQMLLSGLHVSTEEIETMCRLARDAGALGAKLTGAGGGGCVVALAQGSPETILEAWARAGFSGFSTTIPASTKKTPSKSLELR